MLQKLSFIRSIFFLAFCLLRPSTLHAQSDSVLDCDEQFHRWSLDQDSEFIGDPVLHPAITRLEAPAYPDSAKKHGIESDVRAWVLVDTLGNPICATILKPVGNGFDEAVLSAVRKSTFKPPTFKGKKFQAATTIPFRFRMNRGD